LEVGTEHDRDLMLRKLIDSQYVRNDTVLGRGRFRVKGDVVEVQPANQETAYRISFFGDEVRDVEADHRACGRRDPPRARATGDALRVGGPDARGAPHPPAHRVRPR